MTKQILRYFTSNSDWGIEIKTCGYVNAQPFQRYPAIEHPDEYQFNHNGRKLNGFHIVYIASGKGHISYGRNQNITIDAGDLILLYENQRHLYRPDSKTGWEEYWVGFDGSFIRDMIIPDLFKNEKTKVKHIGYNEDVIQLFEQVIMLSKRLTIHKRTINASLLTLIAQLIEAKSTSHSSSTSNLLIEESLLFIRQHLNRPIDLKKLAKHFGMSYSGYRKLFKRHVGISLNQFIIYERLVVARRMLKSTTYTIQEVAEKSGFSSVHYFSRLYKRKKGRTPREDSG